MLPKYIMTHIIGIQRDNERIRLAIFFLRNVFVLRYLNCQFRITWYKLLNKKTASRVRSMYTNY